MANKETQSFNKGDIVISSEDNGLITYSGAEAGNLSQNHVLRVAERVTAGLNQDPGVTIPQEEDEIVEAIKHGLTTVVFEHTDTGEGIGDLLAFVKLKPYRVEGGEKPFGEGEFLGKEQLQYAWEAGSMLGPRALGASEHTKQYTNIAATAMRELVQVAELNDPDSPVIAVTRKGNRGAAHALHVAGGVVFAHKPTTRLRRTPEQQLQQRPVWADLYNMRP